MALEDAVVLAELLLQRDDARPGPLGRFTARRYERAKTVVDASNALAQWQLDHVQGDIPALMRSSPNSPASPPKTPDLHRSRHRRTR